MRNRFIETLIKRAEQDERIVLIVGDLGYGVIEEFQKKFPDRFYNAGVAEQNMASMAAGLASEGFRVFIYSIANFPTFRCAEQIRNDIDYHNLNVTIVAVGGGLSYGALGYSHHAVQDFGLLRMMPNMSIFAPCCPNDTEVCIDKILIEDGPSYLRLGKAGEKIMIKKRQSNNHIEPIFLANKKKLILTTGSILQFFNGRFNEYDCYCISMWGQKYKPSISKIINNFISKYEEILIIEEHLIDCGFASFIMEIAIEYNISITNLKSKHITKELIGEVGTQQELLKKIGL